MNERLCGVLNAIAPTYHLAVQGAPEVAITYALYATEGVAEAGAPVGELLSYKVNVFQRRFDGAQLDEVVHALRADGWSVGQRVQLYDEDDKYYQYSIDVTIWRRDDE